jgi:hypothetical protein
MFSTKYWYSKLCHGWLISTTYFGFLLNTNPGLYADKQGSGREISGYNSGEYEDESLVEYSAV